MSVASGTLAVGWTITVAVTTRLHEPLVLLDPDMQVAFYALAAVGIAVLLVRVRTFDLPGRQP